MRIKFIGTGPDLPIPRANCDCPTCKAARKPGSKSKRLNTSVLINDNILIEATPYIEEQLSPRELNSIEHVLITHAHHDCIDGLNKLKNPDLKVYSFEHTLKIIELRTDIPKENLVVVKPFKKFDIGTVSVFAIPIKHSVLEPKFDPTIAWYVNGFLFAGDIDEDFFLSKEANQLKELIKDAKIVAIDGAMCKGKLRGHMNIFNVADELRKLNPKNLYFVQIGHSCPPHEELQEKVKPYGFKIAYDGLVLNTNSLSEYSYLYLKPPHARLIWEGKKELIVLDNYFGNRTEKPLHLISDSYDYGIITLHEPKEISIEKFRETFHLHQITELERQLWWKNKDRLYAYTFSFEPFKEPKRINPIKKEYFLSEADVKTQTEELMRVLDINTESLKKVSDKELLMMHLRMHQLYNRFKKNLISIEDIVNAHRFIVNEMKKRGMKHNPIDDLDKTLKKITMSKREEYLKQFKDFKIMKDAICMIGSMAEGKENPHDIDILIRIRNNPQEFFDYFKRAIETRISKMFEGTEYEGKLHFVWGDPEGAHDSFVPLYDLKFELSNPLSVIEMSEEPYVPMKPHSPAYYDIEKAIKIASKWNKASVEKKYNGFHAVAVKRGSDVKIYSEQKKDISFAFPTLIEAIKKLSDSDFTIDGELVPYKDGKALGRNELMKFVGAVKSGKKVDDSEIKFFVWDITYKDRSLTDEPLSARKQILKTLKFNDRVKIAEAVTVSSTPDLKKAIEKVSKLPGSEGAVIKDLDSKYTFGESNSWIKYRHLVSIDVRVIDKITNKAGNFNYLVGIDTSDPKIDQSKIVQVGSHKVLKLGKTFNTDIDANPGDILEISVEEVWRHEGKSGIHYSIHKPRVIQKLSKSSTSTIKDLEDIVTSIGVAVVHSELQEDDGETREEAAKKFWKENWYKMYPKSGKGKFVWHHHWRGLTEEDKGRDDKDLMCNSNHSVHGDLRCEVNSETLWGFTAFFGKTSENCPVYPDRLVESARNHNVKVQGTFKLAIPHSWLDVAKKHPVVIEPSGVGATSKKYAKFFVIDSGTYEMGVWREHNIEIFLHGKYLKGRCLISYAPVGESRKWLIYFPKDQTPYADSHDKEKVIKELKSKGQKYLIWAKPGVKPELIKIGDQNG